MSTSKMEYLSPHELTVDRSIQRGLNQRWAKKLTEAFNPDYAGALTVSVRADGSKVILDGQHRNESAKASHYQGLLPCVVYYGLSRAEEAALFITLNTTQKVMPIDRFLVRVVEGDKTATLINDMVKSYGYIVGQGKGCVAAVSALEKVYEGAGISKIGEREDLLHHVFRVSIGAWGHDSQGMHMAIISGLGQLYARCGNDVDTEKLINEMAKTRPLTLVGQAKAQKDVQGGTLPAAMAKVLTGLHNKSRRINRLPEWTWAR